MKFVLVSLALLAGTTGVAAADGWIDCNGPDKSGHGCSATGDRAATLSGIALVTAVALGVGRKRRK